MFYSQGSLTTSNPQPQTHLMTTPHRTDRSRSTSLPSFNELLTSIPLNQDFTSFHSRAATASTSRGSSTSSSPYNYYSQPVNPRMPNLSPPINTHSSQARSPSMGSAFSSYAAKSHYQYQSYPQALHPAPVAYATSQPAPSHPQRYDPAARDEAPPLIRSTSSPIDTTRSSTSSPLDPGSPESESPAGAKDSKRKHVCKVCTRSFTTSGHLARHNRVHTGERKHVCPWPTCDARFARQDNCMQHYKTHTKGRNKRRKLKFKASNAMGSPSYS